MFSDYLSVFYGYDKNKLFKKNFAANFESLADNLENCKREDLHKLLHAYVYIFTKYINATYDNTYKNFKRIINDQNIAFSSSDKESCVVIKNHSEYFKKTSAYD